MAAGFLLALTGARDRGQVAEAAFIGAILFGAGLISLTILACTEPRWPGDEERRRRRDDRFDDI
jgi:hypothetical protein